VNVCLKIYCATIFKQALNSLQRIRKHRFDIALLAPWSGAEVASGNAGGATFCDNKLVLF